MSDRWQRIKKHRGLLALVIGLLLVCCVMAAGATGWFIFRDRDGGNIVDQTTPEAGGGPAIRIESASAALTGGGETGEGRLQVRLSKGQAQPSAVQTNPVTGGEPLSEEEIQQIIDRLPPFEAGPEDVVDFQLPETSLPPPRPGQTVQEPFPPPAVAGPVEAVDSGPLEVLRFAPEGEIPLAPFLNVTFNQPMVPLTSLEALAAEDVPVQLSPPLAGLWKWLGTKTLTFEFQSDTIDRFPMATAYRVEIPAGTESAVGGVLAETVAWEFSTPPPTMIDYHPANTPQPLEPLFFIAFDQRIDPQAVLGTVRVNAGNQQLALRLAGDDEVQADKRVSRLAEYAGEGRWLAFRATQPLPADTGIVVSVGPGTPSAEGPLVTQEAQNFDFHTYAPLHIQRAECGWSSDPCPPFTPFNITFNNPIELDLFDESMLAIDPILPGATVNLYGNNLTIKGATQGRTTYRVSLDGDIQDIFGQKLGSDQTVSFKVGKAEPLLIGPQQTLVTLDPSLDELTLSVYSVNNDRLHLSVYAVEPADWPAYKSYLRDYWREDNPPGPPGRLVLDEVISTDGQPDTLTETGLDLGQALDGDFGQLLVVVEPARGLLPRDRDRYRNIVQVWVQATQIGLDAFADHSQIVVWTSALQDGAPLEGVNLTLGNRQGVSGPDGTVNFDLSDSGAAILVARQGQDTAILPRSDNYWGDDTWSRRSISDDLRWYVFDDRQMYRPGEEVHVKGWLRRVGGQQDGDIGLPEGLRAVRYEVTDPQGNSLGDGRVETNALGGFDLAFSLPENTNLGYAGLRLNAEGDMSNLSGQDYYHTFQIQEFRRPEFEVLTRSETEGPYLVREHAVLAVSANYFAGGPLPNAEVNWTVTSSPGNYDPPGWPDFNFGRWTPWWFFYEVAAYEPYEVYYEPGYPTEEAETFSGVTDAAGVDYLRLDFEAADEPRPYSVNAEATVMDVNRQAWAAATNLLVHPSELYVGLRSQRTFVERGTPLEIEAIVTDIDGNPAAGRPVMIKAGRLDWKVRNGAWSEEEVEVQECTVQSTTEPESCTFETTMGGTYRITATVTDDQGRLNESQFTRWVSGGRQPAARKVEQETAVLIPDKETYQPGDVAQILVQAPFSPAEGLLTVSRSGLLYEERFRMAEGTTTLRVPIEEAHMPNLNIQVDLVGASPRSDDQGETLEDLPARPAYASGSLNLNIPPLRRVLQLEVTPQEARLEPGSETAIDLLLLDANGQPVSGGEVAVVVVDEAILALTSYQLADPLSTFYQERSSWVDSTYGRASIILANPEVLAEQAKNLANDAFAGAVVEEVAMEAPAPMATMEVEIQGRQAVAADATPIKVRTDFNPLATFAPAVHTDGAGRAQVQVKLPDNLTRYRVMAVAVAGGNRFGTGEANLTARLPLMVRPSAPRFLNFGDRFELPVVLQNQTDEALEVEVIVQSANVEMLETGRRVIVPANDRVETRFPAAAEQPGTARFQIAAVAGPYADAATISLPVYTPATSEAFATYGVLDEGAVAQPVSSPADVFPQFGGLEISTSSTALQALTDAVLYLTSYRYECSEQLASRILAVAALRDVLSAFSAEGLPSPEALEEAVQRDIERLAGLQNGDGGFPIWERGRESIPFYSIHVAHALQRARLKGFDVPQEMQQRVMEYLSDIESHYPHWYGEQVRQSLSAYALYVRQLMGDVDQPKARRLLADAGLENLSLEAVAWLWQVLQDDPSSAAEVEAIRRLINNLAVETAGAANFTTSYGDEAYLMLHSDRRTDGIILDALIADQPDSDLIPKVVNGLLAHRTAGRWNNTQENVFILLALDRYFNTFEAETPDFVAQIWLGNTYAGAHEFTGRTTERRQTDIPMVYLVDSAGVQDLILSKEGPGRLYYRLGLRYAPTDLDLDPLDMGFIVERSYEAVDDPDDVYQDESGTWHMKAGAQVRVRLNMVAQNRRYHVALVDPLPAGLEIVNPALAVSGDIPQDPGSSAGRYGWWWWGTWYEHQNMRDDRAEAFTTLLWDGVYDYTYITRATTPGNFVVPPAKAEEMYAPEVFGRSGSDRVIVE